MFNTALNLDAKTLTMLVSPLTSSTTGEKRGALHLLIILTSNQKESFFLFVKEWANLSRIRYWCLCLIRRTSNLYLFLAFHLIVNNTPDEGQPASSHTLCQKIEALLSCSVLSFQPGTLLKDGLLQGIQ